MRRYLPDYWSRCLNEKEEPSLVIGHQVAVHADQEAVLSAEVKGSGEASIHIHYTHTVCTYIIIIIIRGGASLSVRIAACCCNKDDLRREPQQHGHNSVLIACSQSENTELLQPKSES